METQETEEYPMGEAGPFVPKSQAQLLAEMRNESVGTHVAGATQLPTTGQIPPPNKYALSPRWSKSREYKKPFDYFLEGSQQLVKIQRLDMGDLLKLGVAEELDFMTKALMTETKPEDTAKAAVSNAVMKSENFSGMEGMINKVCLQGIIKPDIYAVPEPIKVENDEKKSGEPNEEKPGEPNEEKPGERNEDLMYIDEIPFEERMELFTLIFDSEGLSTFRGEQVSGVGDVENVPSVSLPAD